MRHRAPKIYEHDQHATRRKTWSDYSFQAILWSVWTLTVAATAYFSWHADKVAQRPLNLVGMAIHCGVVGIIGLIVMTLIEMRLRPWWFIE
jgi:hypothetical protein